MPITRLTDAVAALEMLGNVKVRDGMARYGIATAEREIGVSMVNIQKVAKRFGRDAQKALAKAGN